MAVSGVQRVLIIVSGVAFMGTMVFTGLTMMTNRPTTQTAEEKGDTLPQDTAVLEQQEQGYERVLEEEPENLTALEGLINARLQMGKFADAIAPLEKMAEIEPENPQVWQALAAIHIQQQDLQNAIAPMEKLVELQPENEELKGQLEQLKQAAENPPPSPQVSPEEGEESETEEPENPQD